MMTENKRMADVLVDGILEGNFLSILHKPEVSEKHIKQHIEELMDDANTRTVVGIFDTLLTGTSVREYHPAYGWCLRFDVKGTLTDDLKCLLSYLFDPRLTPGREYNFVQQKNNNRRLYMYMSFNQVN